jgi:hypothetical protein
LDADKKSGMDDPDLELIKARKMKKLQEQLASKEKKDKINLELQTKADKNKPEGIDSEKNFLMRYLYDRGDEVLKLAEQQYPLQTKIIIRRLNELIRFGEISKISGGDLLSVYRSLGLNIRVDTQISISDHGKTISFSDKLKQSNNDDQDSDGLL